MNKNRWWTVEDYKSYHNDKNPDSKYKRKHFENMYLVQQLRKYYYKQFDLPITDNFLIKSGFKLKEYTIIDDDGEGPKETYTYKAWVKKGYINYKLLKDNEGFYRLLSYGCMGYDKFRIKNFQELQIDYIEENYYYNRLNENNFK